MDKNLAKTPAAEIDSLTTTQYIVNACHDAKGREVTVLDVSEVFDLADYFVIVSGRSDRQVQGICNRIMGSLGDRRIEPISIEGFDDGHWVLLDFEDVIVHVFYEPVRGRYDLEGLWIRANKLDMPEKKEDSLRAA